MAKNSRTGVRFDADWYAQHMAKRAAWDAKARGEKPVTAGKGPESDGKSGGGPGSGTEFSAAHTHARAGETENGLSATPPEATGPKFKSKTEARFAAWLDEQVAAGKGIVRWRYEAITVLLGDGARYTADFVIETNAGTWWLAEVKGAFVREAARVRLLAAATAYPYMRFALCQWKGGQWTMTRIEAR